MWQLIKDFIFMDALHTICFWSLVGIAIIGLVEIIYQIYIARKKIIFADEFIKHIYTIHAHVVKRIESTNYFDTKSLNEIENDLHFVEIHQKEARNSIDTESYKDPIYSLYCLLYYHN